jgi:hypothetical protein
MMSKNAGNEADARSLSRSALGSLGGWSKLVIKIGRISTYDF